MSLQIHNLHARIGDREILKGLTLEVYPGKVHAIMGPNGSGKSTLSKILCGHEDYEVTAGSATLDGIDLLSMPVDARSRAGLFLAFQYPHEIPGVTNANFLRAAVKARLPEGEDIDAVAFYKQMYARMDQLEMDRSFTGRSVNEGFSGGEKKRNEILQMMMLEPKYAILDETDSGLDIDALKIVSRGVNAMRSDDRGFLVITHYQRLLNYIQPDVVHVLMDGRIVKTGGKELSLELEERGYDWVRDETEALAA
jgi:Fe-S cluster assembly ATP-binding protein